MTAVVSTKLPSLSKKIYLPLAFFFSQRGTQAFVGHKAKSFFGADSKLEGNNYEKSHP
jgi:hypothetical protein